MAFPTVEAVNGGNEGLDTINHTVNLPAGINAGDLLLVFFCADGNPTITFPAGWTPLFQTAYGAKFGCWRRVADGGEGATINVTTSSSERSAHTSYRVTGYSGTPEVGTTTVGDSTAPNPSSLTTTWAVDDTLWLAACGYDSYGTMSAYPTNYTNGRNDHIWDSNGCGVGTARRNRNIRTEDPGAFTLSQAQPWVANVVAIAPVGAAPPPPPGAGFPQVLAVNGGNNPVQSFNHTVNLPAGIDAGDLLLVFFAADRDPTITFPGGWTQLFQAGGVPVTFGCWYRVASGGEGATITVATDASKMSAHTSYRITDYTGTPEAGTPAIGCGQNHNPSGVTPTWGALNTLWFAADGYDGQEDIEGYPTNYLNGRNDFANNSQGCGVGTARRELNAVSDDPDTFATGNSVDYVATTVVVQPLAPPAAGGGGAGGVTAAAGILLAGA